jgi:uncharacterized protein YlxP (DUF503 family)
MKAQLHLSGVDSLKAKRSIVKSLVERLRSRFNVSAAEVGHNDSKLSAVIAISIVSNQQQYIDTQLDKIINFMRNDGRFYLGTIEREIF